MRYGRYLKFEKSIAASDTGGIIERWHYGFDLLNDPSKMSASRRSLQPGVADRLILDAKSAGIKLSEREIQYRLQAARTYETESQIRSAAADLGSWRVLCDAGFPAVDLPEPADPRTESQKRRDAALAKTRERHQGDPGLPEVEQFLKTYVPDFRFRGDEHGVHSSLESLYVVLDDSERYTAGMVKYDAERRAWLDERRDAVGGDLTRTLGEAEFRLRQLRSIGVSSPDSAAEILSDFFRIYGGIPAPEHDAEDGDEE